jgi:hypothetical protein
MTRSVLRQHGHSCKGGGADGTPEGPWGQVVVLDRDYNFLQLGFAGGGGLEDGSQLGVAQQEDAQFFLEPANVGPVSFQGIAERSIGEGFAQLGKGFESLQHHFAAAENESD